jgi:hypothetical protein
MKDFVMAHPYLTFAVLVLAIITVYDSIVHVCNARVRTRRQK